MKKIKNNILIFIFIVVNISIFIGMKKNETERVQIAIDNGVSQLEIHYNVLLNQQKKVSNAIFKNTIKIDGILNILNQVNRTNSYIKRNILRIKLKKILKKYYTNIHKTVGVLQYHFVLPNNHSFLRMHKPDKFGDDLSSVRFDIVSANKEKKIVRGFHQGRTAHGFRNIFPIFDNDKFLGVVEISFGSEIFQKHLNEVSKLHTHFLIKKNIFKARAWNRNDLVLNYHKSFEDKNYMVTFLEKDKNHKALHLPDIGDKLSEGKKFGIWTKEDDKYINISFLPIKDSVNKKTIAWFVSYKNDKFIRSTIISTLYSYFLVILAILFFIYLFYKIYKQKKDLNHFNKKLINLEKIIGSYMLMTKTNLDGTIIDVSNEYCTLTGYKKEELIGAPQSITRDPEMNKEIFYDLWTTISKGKTFNSIISNIDKHGNRFVCETFIYPNFNNNGKIISYTGFRKDITDKIKIKNINIDLEQKIIERTKNLKDITVKQEQLLALFNKGGVALINWENETWNITYSSESVIELFGYTPKDFIDKKIEYTKTIIDQRDVTDAIKELKDAIKNKANFFVHKPYRIKTKSGEEKWVLDYTLVVKDKNGNITNFLSYISDITSFKRFEIENIKQKDLLQQQAKMAMMGEMISSISHQWRQPLNELSINIQSLRYDYDDKLIDGTFINKFISENQNTIVFMSKTIDDFRNFFKIEKEKISFSIKSAIKFTVSILKAQLKNKNIKLNVIGNDFKIDGFQGEFQQVILNIVNNSKDALIEKNIKNPKIEIILNENIVKIKDNAGGIPLDIIDRVFEPYFTTKEQGKGTGIGLYMSKMIIETNMDGKLSVTNIGNGAEFKIEFN